MRALVNRAIVNWIATSFRARCRRRFETHVVRLLCELPLFETSLTYSRCSDLVWNEFNGMLPFELQSLSRFTTLCACALVRCNSICALSERTCFTIISKGRVAELSNFIANLVSAARARCC